MSIEDRAAWVDGSRTCDGCGAHAAGRNPEGWRILPAATREYHRETGERATCPSCLRSLPIKMGQVYASVAPLDVKFAMRQKRRVVGVDWYSCLVWLRTDDAVRVGRPATVRMGNPHSNPSQADGKAYIPGHRLVA